MITKTITLSRRPWWGSFRRYPLAAASTIASRTKSRRLHDVGMTDWGRWQPWWAMQARPRLHREPPNAAREGGAACGWLGRWRWCRQAPGGARCWPENNQKTAGWLAGNFCRESWKLSLLLGSFLGPKLAGQWRSSHARWLETSRRKSGELGGCFSSWLSVLWLLEIAMKKKEKQYFGDIYWFSLGGFCDLKKKEIYNNKDITSWWQILLGLKTWLGWCNK